MAERGFIVFEICKHGTVGRLPLSGKPTWRYSAALISGADDDLMAWAACWNEMVNCPEYRFTLLDRIATALGARVRQMTIEVSPRGAANALSTNSRAYAISLQREKGLARGWTDRSNLIYAAQDDPMAVTAVRSTSPLGFCVRVVRGEHEDRRLVAVFGPATELSAVAALPYSAFKAVVFGEQPSPAAVQFEQFACADDIPGEAMRTVEASLLRVMQQKGCVLSRSCTDLARFAHLFGGALPARTRRRRRRGEPTYEELQQESARRPAATGRAPGGRRGEWFLRGAPTIDLFLAEELQRIYR